MAVTITAGDTFVIDPDGGTNDHLWIVVVVFSPDYASESALLVNITSGTRFSDPACVLRPSDADAHPYVRHESYVYYAKMIERETRDLLKLGTACRRAVASDALMARIRKGAHVSRFTPRGFKKLISH